jgi:hypothetical protein
LQLGRPPSKRAAETMFHVNARSDASCDRPTAFEIRIGSDWGGSNCCADPPGRAAEVMFHVKRSDRELGAWIGPRIWPCKPVL